VVLLSLIVVRGGWLFRVGGIVAMVHLDPHCPICDEG